jgi:D-alanyl-D-alanine dipeptidase
VKARPFRENSRLAAVLFSLGFLLWQPSCGPGEAGSDAGSAGPPTRLLAPPPPPTEWAWLIGEYATATDTLSLLEDNQDLFLLFWKGGGQALEAVDDSTFRMAENEGTVRVRWGEYQAETQGQGRRVGELVVGTRTFRRLSLGGEEGETFRIVPVREPEELRAEALAATPPAEEGEFLPSDLVELVTLDPTIRLDIRYASTNNFMGEVFYSSPRAFLQRPAAEAVARAHQWLKTQGYGLLIHDGYRPWYVTKMFWDATPEPLKDFVADPASGSRHNRGCAVDLTLFDLETGEPVIMPAGFDEMTPRSHSDYPGGTTRQRWYRRLLRDAMEDQGFTVYPGEWWHFDYQDWEQFRIENQVFEEIRG